MRRTRKPKQKPTVGVSPFLTPTLKSDQQDEKPNDIREPKNGLELTEQIGTGKDGPRPFLGTI